MTISGAALTSFIDAHVHLWCRGDNGMEWLADAPRGVPRELSVDGLLRDFGPLPVAGVVLVAASAEESTTARLLERARELRRPARVVVQLDLGAVSAVHSADRLIASEHGELIAGVRLNAEAAPDWAVRASAAVAAVGLSDRAHLVELLTGRGALAQALRLARTNPHLSVVLDHLGGLADATLDDAHWRRGIRRLAGHSNVHVKLSGWRARTRAAVADDVRFVLDVFGPERVVFGSDWPMAAPSGSYAEVVDATCALLSAAGLGASDVDAVMRLNAATLYGLVHSLELDVAGKVI